MDFEKVLRILLKEFEENKIRYGLIGGFALGILGINRTTVDLDFLILKEDIPKVDKILKSLGYECKFRSENVSQYISPLQIFGEIDFLHAFRETSVNMLARVQEKLVFDGKLKIKVLMPEDIIGLKLQALVNDETRSYKELADIEAIIEVYKDVIDWNLLSEYFHLFNKLELLYDIKKKYDIRN